MLDWWSKYFASIDTMKEVRPGQGLRVRRNGGGGLQLNQLYIPLLSESAARALPSEPSLLRLMGSSPPGLVPLSDIFMMSQVPY